MQWDTPDWGGELVGGRVSRHVVDGTTRRKNVRKWDVRNGERTQQSKAFSFKYPSSTTNVLTLEEHMRDDRRMATLAYARGSRTPMWNPTEKLVNTNEW